MRNSIVMNLSFLAFTAFVGFSAIQSFNLSSNPGQEVDVRLAEGIGHSGQYSAPAAQAKSKQTTVIFDLGDVVLFPDKNKASESFSKKEAISFLISYGMPNREKFFGYLNQLYGKDEGSCYPACFRPWLTGQLSGDQLCADICCKVDSSSLHNVQKNFVKSCAKNLQTCRTAEVQYVCKKAAKLICELVNSVDGNGQPIRVMVLSNWDKESFPLLRQRFSALFDLIGDENIITSGAIGMMKPYTNIFEYLLRTARLDADCCYFFDDSQENVCAARECGINAAVYKKDLIRNGWVKAIGEMKKAGLEYQPTISAAEIKALSASCVESQELQAAEAV